MRALTCTLLLAATAFAGEATLLESLQAETRALAAAADAAVVTVRATSFWGDVSRWTAARDLYLVRAGRVRIPPVRGVLVGSPARVVLPAGVAEEEVGVTLADGREVRARRLGGDAQLGIDVFELVDAGDVRGLEVEDDWAALARGSLVVRTGGALGLGLVASCDARTGSLEIDGAEGAVVIGARGKLLGLRVVARSTNLQLAARTALGTWAFTPQASQEWTQIPFRTDLAALAEAPRPAVEDRFVPGPVIRRVLDDLAAHGRVLHGYLGIVFGEANGEVTVTAVLGASPAAAAGLAVNDRIGVVDGVACGDAATVSRILALKRPGECVAIQVRRGEDVVDVATTLTDRAVARRSLATPRAAGLECVALSGELRAWLGLGADLEGVVVQNASGGAAGVLQRGDVIVRAGAARIRSLEELRAAFAGAAAGRLALEVVRGGETVEVALPLPDAKGK